jgi:oligopeptide transport system ATP-binding protein
MSLLEINNLKVNYNSNGKVIPAVKGVDLNIEQGESIGLVGESGCGKSSLSMAVLNLIPAEGKVLFKGKDVFSLKGKEQKQFRSKAQMIFQDPFSSLNPKLSVGSVLEEILKVHQKGNKEQRQEKIQKTLNDIGLEAEYIHRYPHEFSGGQRQRLGIARSLILNPLLIIADEPVSALDVSVQVQILNLLKRLQKEYNLAYLFIAHDLAVVRYMCTRIYVMYFGRIMESATADQLFAAPAHPYTKALLSAVPDIENSLENKQSNQKQELLSGEAPAPADNITGCPFHPRCCYAKEICKTKEPELKEINSGHLSFCHFAKEVSYDSM